MKNQIIKTIPFLLLLMIFLSFNGISQKSLGNGKWIALFNGKSLKGWHGFNKKGTIQNWAIEEGAMVCLGAAADAHGGDIVTDKTFDNFE